MPRYEVQITETSRSIEFPAAPNQPTPEIRDVIWIGDASDNEAAGVAGHEAWDQKYGPNDRPASSTVRIKELRD